MQIEFDIAKDAVNIAKHEVSMALAADLAWETLKCKPDMRRDYGELRMLGFAVMKQRLYCAVYVDRGDVRRIISLRKANDREVIRYVKNS